MPQYFYINGEGHFKDMEYQLFCDFGDVPQKGFALEILRLMFADWRQREDWPYKPLDGFVKVLDQNFIISAIINTAEKEPYFCRFANIEGSTTLINAKNLETIEREFLPQSLNLLKDFMTLKHNNSQALLFSAWHIGFKLKLDGYLQRKCDLTQFCSVKLKFNKLDYKRLAKCALTDDLQFRPGFLIEKNMLPD